MAHDLIPTAPSDAGLVALLLQQLRVWSRNPRKTVGDLTELAASIKEHGILEPLLVRPLPAPETVERDGETTTLTHEILAGQRRYLGAILAGSDSAPCIVREMGDAEALEISLVENGQRKDPSPLEEGEAIDALVREYGRTVEQIADKLGRDRRYVQRRLALLSLCETAKTWLREDVLPLKHAEMLAAVDTGAQEGVLARYKTRGDLPSAREFARMLSFELMALDNAPFDVKDAKLVPRAGACGPCPKNSASQRDLFDGMGADAHCLDRVCWDAKVEALWERAVKDARKRHLTVLDERELFAWGRVVRKDLPYVSAEERRDREAPQTAVARDPYGTIVPLYDRPKRDEGDNASRAGDDSDDADDIEPEECDRADAEGPPAGESTSVREVRESRRQERQERTRAKYSRLLDVLATPEGLRVALRMALGSVVAEWGGTDLWRCMDVLGLDYHDDATPEADAATVPDADVARVLAAILVVGRLEDAPDEDASEHERALRAMMEAPAEDVTGTSAKVPTEGDATEGVGAPATHRVIVLPDEAWMAALAKGLHGFNAEKNPGAGSSSGGSCRPLREVHTHAGHSDLGKLIDRLNKASIPYLDMGEVTRAQVFDCAPTFRQVRERWNAAHPTRPVTIGDGEPGWAPVESPRVRGVSAPRDAPQPSASGGQRPRV